jgi:hypothetical protein
MPDENAGALQFRFPVAPNPEYFKRIEVKHSPKYRWRAPSHPDLAVMANTKSEARAFFKQQLGKLPFFFKIERY